MAGVLLPLSRVSFSQEKLSNSCTACFFALPVPNYLQEQLTRLPIPNHPHLRRINGPQLHLTLHFIGDGDPLQLAPVLSKLHVPPFKLQLEYYGFFGDCNTAGVLWIGSKDSQSPIFHLHQELSKALADLNIPLEERSFVPHLTLARFSRGLPLTLINGFKTQPLPQLSPWIVDRVSLFSSRQSPLGSIYYEEACIMLEPQ